MDRVNQHPADLTESAVLATPQPEILNLIVNQLHYEPTTLRSCCLVSKPWVPRARCHLSADICASDHG